MVGYFSSPAGTMSPPPHVSNLHVQVTYNIMYNAIPFSISFKKALSADYSS